MSISNMLKSWMLFGLFCLALGYFVTLTFLPDDELKDLLEGRSFVRDTIGEEVSFGYDYSFTQKGEDVILIHSSLKGDAGSGEILAKYSVAEDRSREVVSLHLFTEQECYVFRAGVESNCTAKRRQRWLRGQDDWLRLW